MATFHVRLSTFSRSKGQSAVAAAAYRIGGRVQEDRTGLTFDYTRRKGVDHVAVILPSGAPAWAHDVEKLWNSAEAAEVRSNARTARELLVALPSELNRGQRIALSEDLARMVVERYGVATTATVHEPSPRGDQRNWHVHILVSTRELTPSGFGEKCRILDDRTTGPLETEALRAAASAMINRHLSRAGLATRVDHRSLADQARAAEARGDLAGAVLLTREPRRREARAVVEQRRRGLPVAPGWNDGVRASNRAVLAGYLRGARVEIRRARGSGAPAISVRGLRPSGPGSRAIAAQARQVQRRQRQDERAARRFAAMLERVRVEITEQNRRTVLAYMQVFGRTLADAEALAFHGQRDPGCYAVLRRALEARRAVEEARVGLDTARNRRGDAMVRTAEARAALERTEEEPAPSRLRVLSRREWAQKREAQRIALAQAKWAEEGASERSGVRAEMERVNLAKRALDEVEAQRRRTYGVPGDDRPSDVKPSAPTPPALVQRPSPRVVRRPCRP